MRYCSRILLPLITVLMTFTMAFAETSYQKGTAYRYNGKKPRTALGDVYLKPTGAANGVVSDAQGNFTLALNNIGLGERIGTVRVIKKGMMVFNQQAVDEWSVRKEPLCLILCDVNEFQRQKKELISAGERRAKEKYDKALAELERQNKSQRLQLDDYITKLDSLDTAYKNALKHMDEYADVFARIDASAVDSVAQAAIELFNNGEFERALRLFEQNNYLEKIDDALRTKSKAEKLQRVAEAARESADRDLASFKLSLKAQASCYMLNNDWAKARQVLKGLADKLGTYDVLLDYGDYCYKQNDYAEAEKYYLKCQDVLTDGGDLHKLSAVQNNLARLYSDTQRYSESEALFKHIIETYEELDRQKAHVYDSYLATFRLNLANLYFVMQRYAESEEQYSAALKTFEDLAKTNPEVYEPVLARTRMNLANLYRDTHRYRESEALYKDAVATLERLAAENAAAYEPDLANTLINLAIQYCYTNNPENEALFLRAIAIYERLVKTNPDAFEPNLAAAQTNLALSYSGGAERYDESEALFKSALQTYARLVKRNPGAFEFYQATTLMNLANLYCYTKRYAESEAPYKSAIETLSRLSKTNPEAFEPVLGNAYINLANSYIFTERYDESEALFKEAVKIYKRLAERNSDAFEPDLARAQTDLAILYKHAGRYAEGEKLLRTVVRTYERLAALNPDAFEPSLVWAETELTHIYSRSGDYEAAYKLNGELIQYLKYRFDKNPEAWGYNYFDRLNSQAYYANLLGKFAVGEAYANEALAVEPGMSLPHTNLAASLLFRGKVDEAEAIYRRYKSKLRDSFLSDFAQFEKLNVIPAERRADVQRIKAMLME